MQYKSRVGSIGSWFRLKLMYWRYRITSLRGCSKEWCLQLVYFFLATPTVRPRRPVVLVCWPRTRRSQWWRRPRWARIYNLISKLRKNRINSFYLLETLQILTELGVKTVGDRLTKGTVLPVLLSVQEPIGDLVLSWVEHDSLHTTDFVLVQLTGTLVEIILSFF